MHIPGIYRYYINKNNSDELSFALNKLTCMIWGLSITTVVSVRTPLALDFSFMMLMKISLYLELQIVSKVKEYFFSNYRVSKK